MVLGFREIERSLKRDKLVGLVIAPNLDSSGSSGLDRTVEALVEQCRAKQIPVIFAMSRKELAYCLNRLGQTHGVSCVGLVSMEGQGKEWTEVVKLSGELEEGWLKAKLGE